MRGLISLPLVGMVLWGAGCPEPEETAPQSEIEDVRMVALVADNETGDEDENGQTEDWVDITNSGTQTIRLEGWTLTDDQDSEDPWVFPAADLAAGATVRVWCDEDPDDGELHASFKLSKDGESLTLFDAGGAVVDAVTWPALGPDEVYEWDGSEWRVRQ